MVSANVVAVVLVASTFARTTSETSTTCSEAFSEVVGVAAVELARLVAARVRTSEQSYIWRSSMLCMG